MLRGSSGGSAIIICVHSNQNDAFNVLTNYVHELLKNFDPLSIGQSKAFIFLLPGKEIASVQVGHFVPRKQVIPSFRESIPVRVSRDASCETGKALFAEA